MFVTLMKSKIHRAKVTETNLNYVGSITIDPTLMKAAGLYINEKVQICNLTNGNRLETYVIEGEADSGEICINGAAAHLVNEGDIVIIISYGIIDKQEVDSFKPKIVFVDPDNKIVDKCNIEVDDRKKGC